MILQDNSQQLNPLLIIFIASRESYNLLLNQLYLASTYKSKINIDVFHSLYT